MRDRDLTDRDRSAAAPPVEVARRVAVSAMGTMVVVRMAKLLIVVATAVAAVGAAARWVTTTTTPGSPPSSSPSPPPARVRAHGEECTHTGFLDAGEETNEAPTPASTYVHGVHAPRAE